MNLKHIGILERQKTKKLSSLRRSAERNKIKNSKKHHAERRGVLRSVSGIIFINMEIFKNFLSGVNLVVGLCVLGVSVIGFMEAATLGGFGSRKLIIFMFLIVAFFSIFSSIAYFKNKTDFSFRLVYLSLGVCLLSLLLVE